MLSIRFAVRPPLLLLLAILIISGTATAEPRVRIGFVEGGDYPWHSVLRQLFQEEFERLLPDSIQAAFVPEGYVSGEWDRDLLSRQVDRMVAQGSVDLAVAIGPWSVEALLEAGFKGDIVALHRFEPVSEGLVDPQLQPISPNLTVTVQTGRFEKDLSAFFALKPVQRLGVLAFGSPEECQSLADSLAKVGERAGFEVVTATGYNNKGTYAFYRAYQELDKDIDALYITSTWGLSAEITGEFFRMVGRDGIAVFSAEGPFQVTRGAFASNSGTTGIAEPYFAAWKAVRIIAGERPSDLPVTMTPPQGLAINEAAAIRAGVVIDDFTAASAFWVSRPDSEDDPIVPLSLAVSEAISAHPGYLARYEAIEAATSAAEAASAAYLPQLQLDGALGYVDDNTTYNSWPEESNVQAAARLSLTQKLFSPTTLRGMKLAKLQVTQEQNALSHARLELEQAVLRAYANLVRAQDLLAIESDVLTYIDRFLEYRAAGSTVGRDDDEVAVMRWSSERQLAAGRVLQARANLAIARILLNLLTGHPAERRLVADPTPFSSAQFVDEAYALRPLVGSQQHRSRRAETLVATALGVSPSVVDIDNRIQLQDTRQSLARAAHLPEIGFRASLGVQDRLENRAGFEEKPVTWQVGAEFSWPLWSGGARRDQVAAESYRLEELGLRRAELLLRLTEQTQSGLTRLSAELFNGVLATNAAFDAEIYVTEMARRPDTTITLLLDAVHAAYAARTRALEGRMRYYEETFALARVLGWSMYERNRPPSQELINAFTGTP